MSGLLVVVVVLLVICLGLTVGCLLLGDKHDIKTALRFGATLLLIAVLLTMILIVGGMFGMEV